MEDIRNILKDAPGICEFDYRIYGKFGSPEGRKFLQDMIHTFFMEDSQSCTEASFAWKDGRLSVWREIQFILEKVDNALIEVQNI